MSELSFRNHKELLIDSLPADMSWMIAKRLHNEFGNKGLKPTFSVHSSRGTSELYIEYQTRIPKGMPLYVAMMLKDKKETKMMKDVVVRMHKFIKELRPYFK